MGSTGPSRMGSYVLLALCWVAMLLMPLRLGSTMPGPVWVVFAGLAALLAWGSVALLRATRDSWASASLGPSIERLPSIAPGAADPDAPERYARSDAIRNVLAAHLPSERDIRLFETVDALGVPTQRVWVRLQRWSRFGQREWRQRLVDRGHRLPSSDLPEVTRATAKGNWLALTLRARGAAATQAWLAEHAAAVEALAAELDWRAAHEAPRALSPSTYEAYPFEAPAAREERQEVPR